MCRHRLGGPRSGDRIFEGDLPFLRRMARAFKDHGVVPELECFDTGHVGLALQLRDEGLLDDPLRVQFVLARCWRCPGARRCRRET